MTETEVTFGQHDDGTCCACGGTERWTARDGHTICSRCHPKPAPRETDADTIVYIDTHRRKKKAT